MGNCLVTTLKDTVANDSLLKIGEYLISANVSEARTLRYVGTDVTLTITDPSYKFVVDGNSVQSVDITGGKNILFPVGQYDILVTNKYAIEYIIDSFSYGQMQIATPLEMVEYSDNLKELIHIYTLSSVSHLKRLRNLQEVSLLAASGTVEDVVSILENNASLNSIAITESNNLTNPNPFTGSIIALANYQQLQGVDFRNTQVYGKIEDLVSAFRNSSPTKTIGFNVYNCAGVSFGTYNGLSFGNGPSWYLKWTPSSIVLQLDTDEHIEDVSTNVRIFAKGISSAQISDWESKNNTVFVIE